MGRSFLVAGTPGSEEVIVVVAHDLQILWPWVVPPWTCELGWFFHLLLHRLLILLSSAALGEARVLVLAAWLGWPLR